MLWLQFSTYHNLLNTSPYMSQGYLKLILQNTELTPIRKSILPYSCVPTSTKRLPHSKLSRHKPQDLLLAFGGGDGGGCQNHKYSFYYIFSTSVSIIDTIVKYFHILALLSPSQPHSFQSSVSLVYLPSKHQSRISIADQTEIQDPSLPLNNYLTCEKYLPLQALVFESIKWKGGLIYLLILVLMNVKH